MSKNIQDFSVFPTDNSSSTNLKYDIIASKLMTGVENHQKRNAPIPSFGASLGLIEALLQLAIAVIFIFGFGLKWLLKAK